MTRRGVTKAIVLAYLREERVMGQLLKHMHQRHGVSASAVREQVRRLHVAGRIERVQRGRYRNIEG